MVNFDVNRCIKALDRLGFFSGHNVTNSGTDN